MIRKIGFIGKSAVLACLLTGFFAGMGAPIASAAGFYLQEQSVSALGASFAGAAAMPRDASTIYFNPAGMTHLEGGRLNIGANAIYAHSDFTNTGSTFGGAPTTGESGNPIGLKGVPNAYFSQQFTDKLWLGIGFSAPFGLGNKYNNDWFGRFDSIKSKLQIYDLQPTAAYRFTDWFSAALAINYQYVEAKLTSAFSDGQEGLSTLEGIDDGTFGYTVGFLFEPLETTRVGITYRSTVNHELEGRVKIQGSNANDFDIEATAQLSTPDIASFAVAHDLNGRWTLLGQANWFGWNNYEAITVRNVAGGIVSNNIQNYQTTWSVSGGAEYKASDTLTLRAGYQFDETPTTDEYRSTRTPDGNRNWYSAGLTYGLSDRLSLDFATTYIDIEEEQIDLLRNNNAARVRADVETWVGIAGLAINYRF